MQPCPTKSPVKIDNNRTDLIPYDDGMQIHKNDKCQTNRNYLDLYVVGKIWVGALSTALVGEKVNVIPIVKATQPEPCAKKPPLMKYTDLPIYQSPHTNFKDGEDDKDKCPDRNVKLAHQFLMPHVKNCRLKLEQAYCTMKCVITTEYEEARDVVIKKKDALIASFRDPENLTMRYAVVAISGVTGYVIGARLRRRILFTSIGLLIGGGICFPKETDEIFRNIVFTTRKTCMDLYNTLSGDDMKFREKIACKNELPSPPADTPPRKCPANK